MKRIHEKILDEASEHVSRLLKKHLPKDYVYHTGNHTENVVRNSLYIAEKEGLSKEEIRLVLIAAWFHDTGYIKQYQHHEKVSMEFAYEFLNAREIDYESMGLILDAIRATEFPQRPTSRIGAVLCDADFMHLADTRYFEISETLRQEWKNTGINSLKKKEFYQVSLSIFRQHEYFTTSCRNECTRQKELNLILLEERTRDKNEKISVHRSVETNGLSMKYSRGVDSMFRMTARNQINLSSIADNKSNILISLNGIIISLGIAFLFNRVETTPEIIAPTIIFLLFSVVTIVLAILSTRPHISGGKFTREDISQMNVNLLFFGNFYEMKIDEYEWAVKEMINNDNYLYATMIKDQFYLGKVLARKYKLLRAAYSVFMVGLVITVGVFILIFILT